jgi:hypothetical protein
MEFPINLPWVPQAQYEAFQRVRTWRSVIATRSSTRRGWEVLGALVKRECSQVAADLALLTNDSWSAIAWSQVMVPAIKELMKAEVNPATPYRKRRRVCLRELLAALVRPAMTPGRGRSKSFRNYALAVDKAFADISKDCDTHVPLSFGTRLLPWKSVRNLRGRYKSL